VIERGGKPVARIEPVSPTRFTGADFGTLMRTLPRPDDDYLDVLEQLSRTQLPIEPPPWEG
jgi:antitoxin (DNA-binding transcriptional repressor) of toxin-antitoxin stability system